MIGTDQSSPFFLLSARFEGGSPENPQAFENADSISLSLFSSLSSLAGLNAFLAVDMSSLTYSRACVASSITAFANSSICISLFAKSFCCTSSLFFLRSWACSCQNSSPAVFR